MHKNKISNDFIAYSFRFLTKKIVKIWQILATVILYNYAWIFRINLGKNIVFYGIPLISRFPESFINIGDKTTIRSNRYAKLDTKKRTIIRTRLKGAKISIGSKVGLNAVSISAGKSILIGNNVLVGFNVTIIDYDAHDLIDHSKRGKIAPVEIQDNVFIGMNSVILKGVTIGKNSVIGANSVVTGDIPDNVIAAGCPCKIIRKLK